VPRAANDALAIAHIPIDERPRCAVFAALAIAI